jgi:hypothetical protein
MPVADAIVYDVTETEQVLSQKQYQLIDVSTPPVSI